SQQLDALRRIASQQTPKEETRWRKGKGGTQMPYTDVAYVIRELNEAFSWDWDFIADNEEILCNGEIPFEVKVRGKLTVRLNGQAVTKTQFGSVPIEYLRDGSAPVSIGDCFKGAASDALKKCASLLGIALDLYDSDSAVHGGHGTSSGGENRNAAAAAPRPSGMAGQILALAQALKWDEAALIKEIHERCGIAIAPGQFEAALQTVDSQNQQLLIQALKAELQARSAKTTNQKQGAKTK